MFTVFLKEANQESLLEVGSKALHLANVINEGVNIPNGFVLKANALKIFMKEHSLHTQVHKEEFIDVFMEAPLPKEIEKEVLASYEKLKELTGSVDLSVAVRSSSSAEDLEDASFAGQYETILNVCDEEQLLYAVKQCWASLFSDRVREYAAQKDISLDAFPMGILIQQMVFPDVSGVIFSLNPITQDTNEIIINASYGLGESIVSGIVTPDTFIVNKETKSIMKDLGLKEVKILPLDNQIIEVETTPEESDSFCLNEDGILSLESVTSKLEKFYEFPVDIEFAIKDDTIFVLQSRPITS
ncbi:PEP/pyruvate-binding domain-containing protein [Peribacillus sp. NPDC097295]|uniref:PEP/pyruvate-binding domain-containing protein n=1 Tax=Peribacillus sp. NPDC097295 TaxID=3364402 RepID=UPI0037FD3C88